MATSKSKKTEQLQALKEKFQDAKGVAFARYSGISVEEVQSMRNDLREQNISYTVIKKTLIQLAAKEAGLADVSSSELEGPVAVLVSPEDEIAPFAALKKYKKEFLDKKTKVSKLDFAGAVFEGAFIDAARAAALADTPTREESLGKIVGMLRGGTQKLHGVFNSGFQGLYNVLQNAEKFAS